MTYDEILHYLYTRIPVFQREGASAYKPGLQTTLALDTYLGHPSGSYRTIHVAGTNGKGSVCHLLAAVLRQSGYKVGLYTSPHLIDFRERIRVNGQMIPKSYVIDFVERHRSFFEPLHPSFFELTSSLAFDYFRHEKVDFAVIEVGLGGRLDSTNIIRPVLSVITNISLDHTQFLGDTLEKIAAEKAGIIKKETPVLIGETGRPEVCRVFTETASQAGAPIYFAQEMAVINAAQVEKEDHWRFDSPEYGSIEGELGGAAQERNARTVLAALHLLKKTARVRIEPEAVKEGFARVTELTGLMGRWQTLQTAPLVVCDTGHNAGGWEYLSRQLKKEAERRRRLYMIVGMVNDKDIDSVLALMPADAFYLFTQASVPRALPAADFAAEAKKYGLSGEVCPAVPEAVKKALAGATADDLIFIGGSTFVVADALPLFLNTNG